MNQSEHQPAGHGGATSGETSPLEQRRRAIKAALVAGPFVATLSGGRALAAVGSKIGCSMTMTGCTSGNVLETGGAEEVSTSDEQTQGSSEPPGLNRQDKYQQQQQPSASEEVLKRATTWKLPQTPRQ